MRESIEMTQAEYGEQLSTGHKEVIAAMDLGPNKIDEMDAEELQDELGLPSTTAYDLKQIIKIAQKHI